MSSNAPIPMYISLTSTFHGWLPSVDTPLGGAETGERSSLD
jgi:hypothetical protein